jgi:hypothetical protein
MPITLSPSHVPEVYGEQSRRSLLVAQLQPLVEPQLRHL